MKAYSIIGIICSSLWVVLCGVMLWFEYGVWALACYAAMILALPVSSLLHELGHMLFGAMVKIKAAPKLSLFGSSCCTIIPKTDKGLKKRIIFTALGGLIINALLTVAGLVGFYFTPVPTWLCVALPANFYLLWINAADAWLPKGKTDGYLISELRSNSDPAKVMLAVLTVQAQVLNGKPIEEVDESLLFNVPVIQEDDPGFISLTELRYEYFSAKGDSEQAEKYKQRLEDLKQYLD